MLRYLLPAELDDAGRPPVRVSCQGHPTPLVGVDVLYPARRLWIALIILAEKAHKLGIALAAEGDV
jgi:hypothetical protein